MKICTQARSQGHPCLHALVCAASFLPGIDQINALLKRNGLSDSDMLSIRNYVKYKDTNERMKKDIPHRHYSKENTIGYVNFRQIRLQNKENAS